MTFIPEPVAIDTIPSRGDSDIQPFVDVVEKVLTEECGAMQWMFTADDVKDPIGHVRDIAARLRVRYPAKEYELVIAQRSKPNGTTDVPQCHATLNIALKATK